VGVTGRRLSWPDLGFAGCTESSKLQQDLMKITQLDTKVTQELQMLRERIQKMTTELETYSNIDKLKHDAETKKKVRFLRAKAECFARLCHRLGVCLSHSWSVSKRCKLGLRNLHYGLPQGL